MNITTTARHCELPADVRRFATERLEKLSRFARDIQEVHLIVTAEKYRHLAEISLRLRGQELVGREQATEARTAIDLAADRLEQQMRRFKERRVVRRRGGRVRTADGVAVPEPPAEEGFESDGVGELATEE
jgi:putative sigma-54 modulation protein